MKETSGFIGFLFLTIVGIIIFIFLISLPFTPLMISTCNKQFADFEHRWGYMEGCMIKIEGKWIPSDNYREIK